MAPLRCHTSKEGSRVNTAEICLYCGVPGELTNDHVPPKNLFPKPRPNILVEVRACLACNGGASKDDEYFRQCLVLAEQIRGHSEAMTRTTWKKTRGT